MISLRPGLLMNLGKGLNAVSFPPLKDRLYTYSATAVPGHPARCCHRWINLCVPGAVRGLVQSVSHFLSLFLKSVTHLTVSLSLWNILWFPAVCLVHSLSNWAPPSLAHVASRLTLLLLLTCTTGQNSSAYTLWEEIICSEYVGILGPG